MGKSHWLPGNMAIKRGKTASDRGKKDDQKEGERSRIVPIFANKTKKVI